MKTELRKQYKTVRNEITDRALKQSRITEAFLGSDEYISARTLFIYSSYGSEVSTDEIAKNARIDKKTLAYPICTDKDGNMQFYIVDCEKYLKEGMYGIREPDKNECSLVYPDNRTIMLVPALAFDTDGYRLGYGKGYYDRYLSCYKCRTVGLAFDECVTENSLPICIYDKNVDMLITDKKKYKFQNY